MILITILMGIVFTGLFLATFVYRRCIYDWPVDVGVPMMLFGVTMIAAVLLFAISTDFFDFIQAQIAQLGAL